MRIALDPNIPFISRPLEGLARVSVTSDLSRESVADADALIIRTRTRCDASLLEGSRVRFIGTATIGTDHIDAEYCAERGIIVTNAPGCNAPGVAQWVLAAIKESVGFENKTLGIIGAGNVGSLLARWAEGLGMRILVNDPPLQSVAPLAYRYCSLETIAEESDVVSIHTPLTKTGPYPTYHLIDERFVRRLRRHPLVLNAARGGVTDTEALLWGLESGAIGNVGIDCWEGEPQLSLELLGRALFATPHIAGYSREGKIRATQMVLDALGEWMGLGWRLEADAPELMPVPERVCLDDITYDIAGDTARLKENPEGFEAQRNLYELRREPGQKSRAIR